MTLGQQMQGRNRQLLLPHAIPIARDNQGAMHQVESTDVEKRVQHSLSIEHEGNNSWVQNVRLSHSLSY